MIVISSTCSKCAPIEKSGKISCCGRGGSWFRNCGSGGNSNLDHTWSEGIRACETRLPWKTAIDQRRHAAQHLLNASNGIGVTHHKAVITSAKILTLTQTNTSISTSIDWVRQGVCCVVYMCVWYVHDVSEAVMAFSLHLFMLQKSRNLYLICIVRAHVPVYAHAPYTVHTYIYRHEH